MKFLLFSLLLTCASAVAQLQEYKATDIPRAGENIAQPCDYQALFPAGDRLVRAGWVTYDRGPDITHFYTDPEVLAFAKRNDLAMVLAIQCPAKGFAVAIQKPKAALICAACSAGGGKVLT